MQQRYHQCRQSKQKIQDQQSLLSKLSVNELGV